MTDPTLETLTRELVLAEPAGPRLDAWVAMARGWAGKWTLRARKADGSASMRLHPDDLHRTYESAVAAIPRWKERTANMDCHEVEPYDYRPSSDWSAAGPLLEELRGEQNDVRLDWPGGEWRAEVDVSEHGYIVRRHEAKADTAPLAIARAYVIARRGL